MVMYVLVAWALLNGQIHADSVLYKSKEKCEENRTQFFEHAKANNLQKFDAVCINVMEKRI